jgi:AraC family transcriptional regulator of arabinose operon
VLKYGYIDQKVDGAMEIINDLNMSLIPVHLKFAYSTYSDFAGFYHAHQGIEVLYVHQGQGDVLVNRKMYEVRDHTILLFQPYQLHRIRMNVSTATPFTRSKFMIEPSFMEEKLSHTPHLQAFFRRLWKQTILQPVLYDMNRHPRLMNLMDDYNDRLQELTPSEKQEESVLFLMEFIHLLKSNWSPQLFGEHKSSPEREPHHAESIIHWLEQHLHEPLELDRLAHDMHLSKHHLSRLFKRSTGSTIGEYLTVIRIQRACRLLETSDRSVEQISLDVGIGNTSYFCEIFKKAMGSTPLQYRLFLTKHA